jgi:prophage antirepressor-like protein
VKFVKQNFMGIELDVLIGHPEHDLLFVATQVARAAGLKNPAVSASDFAKVMRKQNQGITLLDVASQIQDYRICGPKDISGRALQLRAPLLTEANVYQFLLKGHAPQSEPFRKWVTEEVLPSIRKTGTYNIHESETKEAQQFAGEFAQLHSAISELTSEVLSLKEIIAGFQKPSL